MPFGGVNIDIQMLSVELIDVRIFPGWSMGFLGKSRTYEQLFGHMAEMTGLDERHFKNNRILKLMPEIAAKMEATSV